ncbi:Gamma-aminobutyric acid receptor subunit beta [Folsomia candida]|uniref:Gamma-aminobutyric acid receptor subunit beta n=1 Tax=Folsomia candida TaxID=158441 RepID=A0A226EL93_FOLCA|nr:Gamma-aminobutyric acid receptor subunit beta [Folsomia candida]
MAPLIKYILLLTLIQQSLGNSTNGKPRRSPSPSSSGPSTTFPSHDELKTLSRNITAILDAFSANYDKRVRPNYGGEPRDHVRSKHFQHLRSSHGDCMLCTFY